jgi:hypothetical protein
MIELTETQSFAQVGKEHLSPLQQGALDVDSEFGSVTLSLLPEKHTSGAKDASHRKEKHRSRGLHKH